MSLYSLRTIPIGYAMTKFDEDLNPQATYLMNKTSLVTACSCPAARRPTCRHREMVPLFIVTNRIDTGWFYDHKAMKWIAPIGEGDKKAMERRI